MNLATTLVVYAGGEGSGCHGPNCGRKPTEGWKDLMVEHNAIKNHPFREGGNDERTYKMQNIRLKSLIGRIEQDQLGGSTHEDLDEARDILADATMQFYKGNVDEALRTQETALTRIHEFIELGLKGER
jgi:hypothetical protein